MRRKPDEAHRRTDQELSALEKRIAAEYKKAAQELTEKIDAYFARFQERDAAEREKLEAGEITQQQYTQWRLAQIGRGKRFEALRDRIAERMTRANEVSAAYINDRTPGIYSLNRNYAAYTIEQQVGRDVGFDLWDEQTVKRLIVERPDLMPYYPPKRAVKRGIDLEWGKRQITAQVTSGILQGESIKHIADRLQDNIPQMNRDSAVRAARTAVTGAQNAGRQDSYQQAAEMGIQVEKQWLATLDNRTRHDHAVADGQTVPKEEPFLVGGYPLMYPGDPSGPGHEIYNCRCTMIAKVKGVDTSNSLRRDRYGLLPNMTYAQWEASKRGSEGIQLSPYQKDVKDIAESPVERYNKVIERLAQIDNATVFQAAKNGGRHKGVYNDAINKKQSTLEKSIASHVAQVEEHADKVKNPEKYDTGWGEKDARQREGLLKKWEKDRRRNAEQAAIELEVWKERFGNDSGPVG